MFFGRSLLYSRKRVEHRIKPRGMLASISRDSNHCLLSTTYIDVPIMKDLLTEKEKHFPRFYSWKYYATTGDATHYHVPLIYIRRRLRDEFEIQCLVINQIHDISCEPSWVNMVWLWFRTLLLWKFLKTSSLIIETKNILMPLRRPMHRYCDYHSSEFLKAKQTSDTFYRLFNHLLSRQGLNSFA